MKTGILILLGMAWSGLVVAQPQQTGPQDSKPDRELGEAKVEQPIKLEKAAAPENIWTESRQGVIGQFLQAPSPLQPINPLAKPAAGYGAGNLSKDTVTGRIMGLRFLKFEF